MLSPHAAVMSSIGRRVTGKRGTRITMHHASQSVSIGHLVGGQRSIAGSIAGTPFDSERALDLSLLTDARPRTQTMPLDRAPEAYAKMLSGDATLRMVLTMKE